MPRAPLHHGDRIGDRRVQVEVVQLGGAAQPVGVDVHQRRAAGGGAVDPGQHEGRRDHRPVAAQPAADALGQGGLAGAQITGGDDQVARAAAGRPAARPAACMAAPRWARRSPPAAARTRITPCRHVAVDDEAPVPPEVDQLGELLAGEQLDVDVAEPGGAVLGRGHHGRGDAVPLEVRVNRDPGEGRHPGRRAGLDQHRAGRPAVDLRVDAAAAAASSRSPTSGVSAMAVDGGSSGGRAPKAAWMTSTIPAASRCDATDTTRSRPRRSPAAIVIGRSAGDPRARPSAAAGDGVAATSRS